MNARPLFLLLLVGVVGLCSADAGGVDGLVLIGELNCVACHAATENQAAWMSPKLAPRLEDVGTRVGPEWLQRHLASPQGTMSGSTMPDVLHGMPDVERALASEALTHHLLSLAPGKFRRVLPDRAAVARGENLYHRVGCVACHAPQNRSPSGMISSPLPSMVEKWSFEGLRLFLQDPLATRPSGRMPGMNLTDIEAADIAHYLLRETRVPATLEVAQYRGRIRSLEDLDSGEVSRTGPATHFTLEAMGRDRGYALRFAGWLQVDRPGEYTFRLSATGASRLSVRREWLVGEDSWERESVDAEGSLQLDPGWHPIVVDYVQRGSKDPALKVEWEGPGVAREVIPAARMRSARDQVGESAAFIVDAAKAARGRALYQELNCATCHESKPPTVPLPSLAALHAENGCLAEKPAANAPDYLLDATQRDALRAALTALKRPDLAAPSARQRVAHTLASLQCTACHVRDGAGGVAPERDAFFTSNGEDLGDEGRLPPRLDGVGDRLRPAWLGNVLATGASVRSYSNTRMPQFGADNIRHLTGLFVALDRREQSLPPAPDAPDVQRAAGRRMIGTDGLSCIACHRFNRQPAQALQIIDLTTATERLNEDWFRRFLLDPARFHPGTRMPSFWPDGVSPLTSLLGGDTDRQHAALWTYLAEGSRAKFPEGLSRQSLELVVGGEAVVYRGKLWEAGFRAVAVGYPGQLNAAFDAEEMRFALLWRGRFLNAGPHWGVQGMGSIRPLGTNVVIFPHGPALAVLQDALTPWPVESSKALGMKFRGYQLDGLKQPVLLYSFHDLGIEDFLSPTHNAGKTGLRRTVKFTGSPPGGLHLRLATGRLMSVGDGSWRLDDSLTLRVRGGADAFVRGESGRGELLVPISSTDKNPRLEVEYVW